MYQFKRSRWTNIETDDMLIQCLKRGFNDAVEYPTVRDSVKSLPSLSKKGDLMFFQDRNI